jgi:hypothetical protein
MSVNVTATVRHSRLLDNVDAFVSKALLFIDSQKHGAAPEVTLV